MIIFADQAVAHLGVVDAVRRLLKCGWECAGLPFVVPARMPRTWARPALEGAHSARGMPTSYRIRGSEYDVLPPLERSDVQHVSPPSVARGPRPWKQGCKIAKIAFVASDNADAVAAHARLTRQYGDTSPQQADVIVALGGDGFMLQTLHRHLNDHLPIYGMNRGSVGFLMNEYREDDLFGRLERAEVSAIHPLRMLAQDASGASHEALAINEVSLFRQSCQAGKLRITVDGKTRLDELVCDGALVATPAGSTAYNLSVHGPILPISAPLLALTPISSFRPRRWRGAVLPNSARIKVEVLEATKRPMSAVANHREFRNVLAVSISEVCEIDLLLMFDRGRALGERILSEQFSY